MSSPVESLSERKFWGRFADKAEEGGIPFEAMIELTYGCNLRCVHCYNPTHEAKGELTTAQICRIIDQLAELGTFSLAFTGGEIFTRGDCFQVFDHAKAQGFSITLLTNATLITPEKADRIRDLAPTSVEVSIYGASAQTYERVTGLPGSFERFKKGVQLLRERKVPLLIKMPVMTLNQQEAQQARNLVQGWGIRFVYTTEIHPRTDKSLEPLCYRLEPPEVVRVHQQMVGYGQWKPEWGEQAERCNAERGMFTCKCGKTSLAITPHGEMNLCVALPIPQYGLKDGDVATGWRTLVNVVRSAKPSEAYACASCSLEPSCKQGPMDAWLETSDLNPCLPYFKELAGLEVRAFEAANLKEQRTPGAVAGSEEDCRSLPRPLIAIERKSGQEAT